MNKIICALLATSLFVSLDYGYNGSTTAPVVLVGSIIRTQHIDKDKKYPRKECPVCKGTGKYLSGDGIKMVDCGYCDPDIKSDQHTQNKPNCQTKVSRK